MNYGELVILMAICVIIPLAFYLLKTPYSGDDFVVYVDLCDLDLRYVTRESLERCHPELMAMLDKIGEADE